MVIEDFARKKYNDDEATEAVKRINERVDLIHSKSYNDLVLHRKLKQNMFNASLWGEEVKVLPSLKDYDVPEKVNISDIESYDIAKKRALRYVNQIMNEDPENSKYAGNLLISGSAGTGKTYLAESIMNDLITKENDKLVIFLNMQVVKDYLFSWTDPFKVKKVTRFKEYAKRADLLILDDIGTDNSVVSNSQRKLSDPVGNFLYEVANYRVHKSTLITTNLTSSMAKSIYDERIYSRLFPKKQEDVILFRNDEAGLPNFVDLRGRDNE